MVERFDFTKLQEDETYIYTDKAGNLQKGMDLTVTWLGSPDKTVLITASQSDSLDYLKILIGEAMSKYPLFEGLTQLMARKLQDDKGNFIRAEEGKGPSLKSGEHLWCDLVAQDLWVDVRLEVPREQLRICFEVRINCNATNEALKQFCFNCASDVLQSYSVTTVYNVQGLQLYRYTPNAFVTPDQGRSDWNALPRFDTIGDTFDFSARFVTGVLIYTAVEVSSDHSSNDSLSSEDSEIEIKRPCQPLASRNLLTQKISGIESSADKFKRRKSYFVPNNERCGNCSLL